jgi:hypothetical protein
VSLCCTGRRQVASVVFAAAEASGAIGGLDNDSCSDATSNTGAVFATTAAGNVVTLERTTATEASAGEATAVGVTATGAVIANGTSEGADRGAAVRVGFASCLTARRSGGGTISGLGTALVTGVGGEASERDINAAATATTPTVAVAVPNICNSLRTVTRLTGLASIPPGTEAISSAEIAPT